MTTSTSFEALFGLREPDSFSQPYAQHPWVHAVVRAIARLAKGVPMRVMQRTKPAARRQTPQERMRAAQGHRSRANRPMEVDVGAEVTDYNDPMVRLFERPNPLLPSAAKLIEATMIHRRLTGGCVWVKIGMAGEFVTDPKETPRELWPLPISAFHPEFDRGSPMLRAWRGRWGNGEVQFQPHQLVVLADVGPGPDGMPVAPMQPAGISAEADWAAMSFNAAFFQNGASTGGMLKTKASLSVEQARALRDRWNDMHEGQRKGHRVAVLTGETEFVPSSRAQRDMEFGTLRETARRELTAVLGPVAPILLGLSDDYTRATAAEAEAATMHYTILPELRDIEDVLAVELGNWSGGQRWLEFDVRQAPGASRKSPALAEAATKLFRMGVPLEQVNEILRLGLRTDTLPHARASFVDASMRAVDDIVAGEGA